MVNQKGLSTVLIVIFFALILLSGYFIYQRQTGLPREKVQEKISPRGKIVYIHKGDVWVMSPDGSEEKQLTSYGFNSDPVWSPDGQKIAYRSSPASLAAKGRSIANCTNYHNIWIINRDGSDPVQITSSEAVRTPPGWSSDSKQIAFREDEKLIVYDLETKAKKILVNDGLYDKDPNLCRIGSSTAGSSFRWYPPEDNVLEYSYNGVDFFLISALDGKVIKKIDRTGIWSKDGSKMVYLSPIDSPEPGSAEIVVLFIKSGRRQVYKAFNNQAHDLHWSPDGNKILYSSREASIVGTSLNPRLQMSIVRILDVNTKEDRNISDNIVRSFVSERKDRGLQTINAFSDGWSPDGKSILLPIDTEEHKPEYRHVNQVNLVDFQTGTLVRTLKEGRLSSLDVAEYIADYHSFSWSAR